MLIRSLFILTTFCLSLQSTETKPHENYRVYNEATPGSVREFYRQNHTQQTLDFVLAKKAEYLALNRYKMGIWDAINIFDSLIDESDPDLDRPQRYHLFQTGEALRKDGCPRWLIVTGFIHDLGKILAFYGEPQWAVVGDTFPVGCAFSDTITYSDFFANNPDRQIPDYQTQYGIYEPGCGLDAVHFSWGHDEYLYHVVKNYLPFEASFLIRYHSSYAVHQKEAYLHLMNERDKKMLPLMKTFSTYDLYSKNDEPLDIDALLPYYQELVAEFFPNELEW